MKRSKDVFFLSSRMQFWHRPECNTTTEPVFDSLRIGSFQEIDVSYDPPQDIDRPPQWAGS